MAATSKSDSDIQTLVSEAQQKAGVTRIVSVDLLRGLVMVIMALDHVRIYFSNIPFQPENMELTYPALFFTRWITHFCAPVFFLLAGTSTYLSHHNGRSMAAISRFLWQRGLWLVFLELTILGFSWSFLPGFNFGGVIWALGWSMVIMAALVRLPLRWLAVLGAALAIFHHLLDGVAAADLGPFYWLWLILHANGMINIPGLDVQFFILYPLIPAVGVMALGFALGRILIKPTKQRRRSLIWIGSGLCLAFVLLRMGNLYGFDPARAVLFSVQESAAMTVVSFLNTQKYPFSLQFLLMTLGPALLFMAWMEGEDLSRPIHRLWQKIAVFGRVPMFYYVQHILLIHILAVIVAILWQQPVAGLIAKPLPFVRSTEGYGHGLFFIYAMTVAVNIGLYFSCRWFAALRQRRKDWWLRYL